MTWAEFHNNSELSASQADIEFRAGNEARAYELYARAAQTEEEALRALDRSKARTLGITAVSAASLWLMARNTSKAQQVAYVWLSSGHLPGFAVAQMRDLLQTIWGEEMRASSKVKFLRGDVTVSIGGGQILYGGAPLDLILRKVEEIRAVIVRTVEWKLKLPLRKNRPPDGSITQMFEPWLIQQPAGSYQFAVRVKKPEQAELFPAETLEVSDVAMTALDILRASIDDPEGELVRTIPDAGYRDTFIKLARNLAPTGKTFETITIGSVTASAAPVVMAPAARDALNATIKRTAPTDKRESGPVEVKGVLRDLSLNNDWLVVSTTREDGTTQDVRISGVGETLDDIIGPMVNHGVLVRAYRKKGGQTLHLADIEPDE